MGSRNERTVVRDRSVAPHLWQGGEEYELQLACASIEDDFGNSLADIVSFRFRVSATMKEVVADDKQMVAPGSPVRPTMGQEILSSYGVLLIQFEQPLLAKGSGKVKVYIHYTVWTRFQPIQALGAPESDSTPSEPPKSTPRILRPFHL